jgi:hypothetical protein
LSKPMIPRYAGRRSATRQQRIVFFFEFGFIVNSGQLIWLCLVYLFLSQRSRSIPSTEYTSTTVSGSDLLPFLNWLSPPSPRFISMNPNYMRLFSPRLFQSSTPFPRLSTFSSVLLIRQVKLLCHLIFTYSHGGACSC